MKAELVLGNLKRERDALENKLERLADALGREWQDADQEYLCTQQYNAMSLYAHILDERIIDIEDKLEQRKAEAELKSPHETCHECKEALDKNDDCMHSCDDDSVKQVVADMLEGIFGVKFIYED